MLSPREVLGRSRLSSSAEAPLLNGHGSRTEPESRQPGETVSQKVYIVTEDLTAVIAGFNTSIYGFAAYLVICILTGGLGYLLFRWLPRWRVRLVGSPTPLDRCQWTAIEVKVHTILYGSLLQLG